MPDTVADYLARLQSRLLRKMPKSVADEHVLEIELHLRESIADELAQGKSEAEAELAAIRALGSDVLIAESLIWHHRGLNSCSDWRFAWVPAAILISYGALAWGVVDVRWHYPSWISTYAIWVPALFVTTFSISCWRSRRLLLKPIAVAASVFLAVILFTYCLFGSSGFSARSEEMRQANVREIDNDMSYLVENLQSAKTLQKGAMSGLPLNGMYQSPDQSYMLINAHSYYVPPIVSIIKKPVWQLNYTPSRTTAKELWLKNGKQYFAQLAGSLEEMQSRRAHWATLRPNLLDVGKFLNEMVLSVLIMCLQLALINAGILGLIKATTLVRSQAWRLKRAS